MPVQVPDRPVFAFFVVIYPSSVSKSEIFSQNFIFVRLSCDYTRFYTKYFIINLDPWRSENNRLKNKQLFNPIQFKTILGSISNMR